jgi:hypothetical protein
MEMVFWNKMSEEGFVQSNEKKNNFGIDLGEIYNYFILHLHCEN